MSKAKKSEAHEKAMQAFRRTHARILRDNPCLFDKVRKELLGGHKRSNQSIAVDKQKNIRTVSALLQMSGQSEGFRQKVKQALLREQH